MSRASSRSCVAACLALAACASAPRVTTAQSAPIVASARTVTLDGGEPLPLGMTSGIVAEAVDRAGFSMGQGRARYRLALTAAAAPSRLGGYLPSADAGAPARWIARPDHGLRARLAGGRQLRITAVLVDASSNQEVWRGAGVLRTADPRAAAPGLLREIMAKLPRD